MTTDENIDPKHPPTSAPMSSSAQNINNNKWKESVAFGTKIFKGAKRNPGPLYGVYGLNKEKLYV